MQPKQALPPLLLWRTRLTTALYHLLLNLCLPVVPPLCLQLNLCPPVPPCCSTFAYLYHPAAQPLPTTLPSAAQPLPTTLLSAVQPLPTSTNHLTAAQPLPTSTTLLLNLCLPVPPCCSTSAYQYHPAAQPLHTSTTLLLSLYLPVLTPLPTTPLTAAQPLPTTPLTAAQPLPTSSTTPLLIICPFADIFCALSDFAFKRNFFGSHHSKGPSDGESAVVKSKLSDKSRQIWWCCHCQCEGLV